MGFFTKVGKREDFPLDGGVQAIQIQGFNGAISWEPMDGGPARVVVEKEVSGISASGLDQILAGLKIEDRSSQGRMVLQAVQPPQRFGFVNTKVTFKVYAPPEQIGEFQAQTSNGAIALEEPFSGKVSLRTTNGRVQLRSGQGEVEVITSNGRIEFGKLVLTGNSAMRTSNGRIAGQVEFSGEGIYLFETRNGAIELRVPHDTRGSFRATTSNGQVEFDVGEDHAVGRKQVTIERSTSPQITIATANGGISVLGY